MIGVPAISFSCRILQDALRFGLRFGRIAVTILQPRHTTEGRVAQLTAILQLKPVKAVHVMLSPRTG